MKFDEFASRSIVSHDLSNLTGFLRKFALFGVCMVFVSCTNMFQDKVAMSQNGNPATIGGLFASGETIGKLDTPSEIRVSLYEFKDEIRVSWSPVKHASYYTLERAVVTEKNENGGWIVPDESEYEVLEHTQQLFRTSYTDKVIAGNENDPLDCTNEKYGYVYFYRVRAENPLYGYEASDASDKFGELPTYGALLPPPSNTKASAGESENYIDITWQKSAGAIRYEIYRSENEDGANSSKVGTVTANMSSYRDTAVSSFKGADLYYTVCSVGTIGEKSVVSPVALGYTLLPGAPKGVEKVRVTKGHGDSANSIEIEWDSIVDTSGAEITYTIYRSSSESSTMKKLRTETGTYTYPDSNGLKQNVYYYYYIQTSKVEKKDDVETILKGPMSKSGPEDADPAEGFILSAPSTVEVQKLRDKPDKCRIDFTPVIGDKNFAKGAKKSYDNHYTYKVFSNSNQSGDFSHEAGPASSPEFKDGKYSMEVSSDNYYRMEVEHNGQKSARTSVVAPAPYEARDVYVTRAEFVGSYGDYIPESLTSTIEPGSNSNGIHPVKITWKAPEGGAASYNIYRSEKRESGFKKITDTPIRGESNKETYEYIDKNDSAKVGSIYYYYIISLNSLGQGVNKSEIDMPTLENNIIKTKNSDGTPYGRGWGWGALSAWQYMREERKTVESSQKKLTLMHKPNDLDKVGSESVNGDISGTLSYRAKVEGLGARITMPYVNYADSYINGDKSLGIYFLFNGDTNTSSNMSANGTMDGIVTCSGMYPGKVRYDKVQIKSGKAGGGTYGVIRDGIDSDYIEVDWKAGEK